jgi:transcriptional regulator with XRE-family HTH domain
MLLNNPDSPVTCLSSLTLLILKEVRIERGIHQAVIADKIGKTPSGWAKVETGKNSLGLDTLFSVCNALMISASAVIASAERHAGLLANHNWCVLNNNLPSEEKDSLLIEMEEYYVSPGFKRRLQNTPFSFANISALNSPVYTYDGRITVIEAFLYIVDEGFKREQLS